jgi:hypothetical protein
MNHAHEDRLLIVTDADGSVHNAVVEALAESLLLEHCDILTQYDICLRLAEADPGSLERIAEIVRNGDYRTILIIAHAEMKSRAGAVAEAERVLTERLEHSGVRGMVLQGRSLTTVS